MSESKSRHEHEKEEEKKKKLDEYMKERYKRERDPEQERQGRVWNIFHGYMDPDDRGWPFG